jgi:hypothetical protein
LDQDKQWTSTIEWIFQQSGYSSQQYFGHAQHWIFNI